MVSDWRNVKLRDVLGEKGYIRGPFGSALRRPELKNHGIPVYEQQHAITGTRDFRFFIDKAKYKKLRRFTVQENDLIVSCSGTLARISVIRKEDPKGIISQALLILRPDTMVVEPAYLYYFMSSTRGFNSLVNVSTGSVQVNIAGRSIIENIDLPLPPLKHQKAIAHILGSLDDKIELNCRMNQTLEATARAVFKSWFVDFDPVRAKADGRPTGLPDHIAVIFPDSFEDSEIGEIPKGWEVGALQDILILQRGFDLPKKKRTLGKYPLIAASGQDGYHNEHKVAGPGVATGRSGKLGIVTFVHSHFWPLNTTLWVKSYKNSNPYHAYFLLQTLNLEAYNAGSAVPTLNRNHIHDLKLPVPNDSVLKYFEFHARNLFSAIDKNTEQIAYIFKIRDTLLPKLISGELRVPNAKKLVKGV